jgi:curli production assembly/transport component CsgG/holdfast attachment protein HfaB
MTRSRILAGLMLVTMVGGCVSTRVDPETGLYAAPIGGAPATANETVLTPALKCLADTARARGRVAPRLAVGEIADLTGKVDLETGRRITQGAALFAVTAFGRAGVPLVERSDASVAEVERTFAGARILSDNPSAPGGDPGPLRLVHPGQIAGSRYYLVGGVTELNYNIESAGGELGVGALDPEDPKSGVSGSRFVMNIAVDLRLVDSVSQEVVAVAAYQKQIVGREIRAGVFDILGGVAIDLSGGVSALEPLQLGVRTLIERGVYDVAENLYGLEDENCLGEIAGADVAGGYESLRPLAAFEPVPPLPPEIPDPGRPDPYPAQAAAGPSTPAASAPPRRRIDTRTWRLSGGSMP